MANIVNLNKTEVSSRAIVIKSELPAVLEGTSKMMEFSSHFCFTGIGTSSRKEVRSYCH